MRMPAFANKMLGRFGRKAANLPDDWPPSGNGYDPHDPESSRSPWNPAQMQLVAAADSAVLGERGVYPLLADPLDDMLWDEWPVDALGLLTPRDYQAVILTCLVLDGEAWVRISPGGYYDPMPTPTDFRHNPDTKRRTSIIWDASTIPGGLELSVAEVMQLVIRRQPFQMRGYTLPQDTRYMMRKSGELALASANAEILFRGLSVHAKRQTAPGYDGGDPTERRLRRKLDLHLREMAPIDLDPGDGIETLDGASPPTSPLIAHEYMAAHIASVLGLSRIALTNDAGQANFSASRLSTETDRRTWGIYRRLLIRASRPVYGAFRGINMMRLGLPEYPEWRHPPAIVMDPARRAQELQIYLEAGIMDLAEVRAELGLPPPTPEMIAARALRPAQQMPALPPGDEESEDDDAG